MKKFLKLTLCISFCLLCSCEDHDKTQPEFYTLSTEIPAGQLPEGFSFKDLKVITFPNSNSVLPDFILSCHTNETGDIVGPMLSHPTLENRFIFLRSYDNEYSAQNFFDTVATVSSSPYQTFALDIKPFEIWQIRTAAGETGILLVLETRTEQRNTAPFAEIKFKARNIVR